MLAPWATLHQKLTARGVLTSYLLILVLAILDAAHENRGLVGEDQAILVQVPVTRIEHGVEHALVEKEIAHPFGYYDVDLGERHIDLLHLALDEGDLVLHAVGLDDLAGLEDDS